MILQAYSLSFPQAVRRLQYALLKLSGAPLYFTLLFCN